MEEDNRSSTFCCLCKFIFKIWKCLLRGNVKYGYAYFCFISSVCNIGVSVVLIFFGVVVRYIGIGFLFGLQFLEGFGMKILGAFAFYGGLFTLVFSLATLFLSVVLYWAFKGKDKIEDCFSGSGNKEKEERQKRIEKQRRSRGKREMDPIESRVSNRTKKKIYELLKKDIVPRSDSSDDFEF